MNEPRPKMELDPEISAASQELKAAFTKAAEAEDDKAIALEHYSRAIQNFVTRACGRETTRAKE